MTDNSPQIESFLWRASVLASLLFLLLSLFASTIHAETDSVRVARLFMWASDGNVRHRDLVEPAKDSLGQMGAKAAPWLAKKLGTSDARERLTLADIFEKIGKPATPFLIPYLDAPGEDTPRNTARCLERIKDTAAVVPLLAQMDHPEYSVRSQVATALGKAGDHRAVLTLQHRLEDEEDPDVRKSCIVALGEIGNAFSVKQYVMSLGDSSFGVRNAAATAFAKVKPLNETIALLRERSRNEDSMAIVDVASYTSIVNQLEVGGKDAVEYLLYVDQDRDTSSGWLGRTFRRGSMPRYQLLIALGSCGGEKVISRLTQYLDDPDPHVRAFSVEGLSLKSAELSGKAIANLKRSETDPFVLAQIARFEQIVIEKKNAESNPK